MQIPVWAFLSCIFVAAVWHDMSSLLRQSTLGLAPKLTRYITPSSLLSQFRLNQATAQSPHTNTPSHQSFHTTSPKMSPPTTATFIEALKTRRTYYGLKNASPIPDSRIQEIINDVVLHVPSCFNSQSTRIVLLLKSEHEKLWDITHDVLKEIVPTEQFASTEQRLAGFKAGYGSVSFPFFLSFFDNE
jgi:uncharacterized protein